MVDTLSDNNPPCPFPNKLCTDVSSYTYRCKSCRDWSVGGDSQRNSISLCGVRAHIRHCSAVLPSARKRTAAPPVDSTAWHPSDSNSCAKSLDNPGTHVAIKSDSGAGGAASLLLLFHGWCAADRHVGCLGVDLLLLVVDDKRVKASVCCVKNRKQEEIKRIPF